MTTWRSMIRRSAARTAIFELPQRGGSDSWGEWSRNDILGAAAGASMAEKGSGRLFLVTGDGPPATDAELIAAYRREEEWAAAALWDRFAPLVRRILFRGLGPG